MFKCWNECSRCVHQKICRYEEEYKQLKEEITTNPSYDTTKDNFVIGLECKNFIASSTATIKETFPGGF